MDFSNKLKKNILIWNIDEWTISRTTKCNYSWSLKGLNKETKNTPFSGSLYLILGVLSNDCWYLLLTNSPIDSIVFYHFVNKISIWIKENQMFNFADTVLTMDNCPSHKSKLTQNILRNLNMQVNFIPVYSLDLAPTELCFTFIKKRLWKINRSFKINLGKKSSKKWNYYCFTNLDK